MTYEDAAVDFITRLIEETRKTGKVESSSTMRVRNDSSDAVVIAVTVKYLSQALIYDVWEVIFPPGAAQGLFARVARTSGEELIYDDFPIPGEMI